MKKIASGFYASVVVTIICLMNVVSGYAQEVVPTYDIKTHGRNFFYYVPVPALIFGSLFIVGIYVIYHYWANGKLRDDMS